MQKKKNTSTSPLRERLFNMVSVGVVGDPVNQLYDILSTCLLLLNLVVSILATFDNIRQSWGSLLHTIEIVTILFFAIDYVLRLITASYLYPRLSEGKAVIKYMVSGSGLIDLMSFLPYGLPFFFPSGTAVFRLFRVVRILRLFRINAYYDSLNVITEVLASKRQQLLSSIFIILVLMIASSLCMYSLEHTAQPEIFRNAFSGIWWSVSTLLTVGYGDIYPVTVLGRFFAIVISFLGVGMVAIPTGIISAGFVEQDSRCTQMGASRSEMDSQFIRIALKSTDPWTGKELQELHLPEGMFIAALTRGKDTLVPHGHLRLQTGDQLLITAEALDYHHPVTLKELRLGPSHPWNGRQIRDLDISRQTLIVLIRRGDINLVPRGSLTLEAGDLLYLHTRLVE